MRSAHALCELRDRRVSVKVLKQHTKAQDAIVKLPGRPVQGCSPQLSAILSPHAAQAARMARLARMRQQGSAAVSPHELRAQR